MNERKYVLIDMPTGEVYAGRNRGFVLGLDRARLYDRLGDASRAKFHLTKTRHGSGNWQIMTVADAKQHNTKLLAESDALPTKPQPPTTPAVAAQLATGTGRLTEGGLALDEAISCLKALRDAEAILAEADAEVRRLREAECLLAEAHAEMDRQLRRWTGVGPALQEALAGLVPQGCAA